MVRIWNKQVCQRHHIEFGEELLDLARKVVTLASFRAFWFGLLRIRTGGSFRRSRRGSTVLGLSTGWREIWQGRGTRGVQCTHKSRRRFWQGHIPRWSSLCHWGVKRAQRETQRRHLWHDFFSGSGSHQISYTLLFAKNRVLQSRPFGFHLKFIWVSFGIRFETRQDRQVAQARSIPKWSFNSDCELHFNRNEKPGSRGRRSFNTPDCDNALCIVGTFFASFALLAFFGEDFIAFAWRFSFPGGGHLALGVTCRKIKSAL